jgi:polyhydroxyalkanoate synthesis regulator phasin
MSANMKWVTRIGAGAGVAALAVGALAGVGNAVGTADKEGGKDRGKGSVAALVTDGTLTSEQATTVKDAVKSARQEKRADRLTTLVTNGTITQTQADALSNKGGLRTLIKSGDMTREEAKALHKQIKGTDQPDVDSTFVSVMSELVANGTIVQAQADAIIEAKTAKRDAVKSARQEKRADRLTTLVTNGTITQTQAGLRTLIKSGDMTREEAKALHKEIKSAMAGTKSSGASA